MADETTSTTTTNSNPLGYDPSWGQNNKTTGSNSLDNEAFMKLFLEQLKNQDPTSPMETQEILTQTAQLTQIEMQEKMKTAMDDMSTAMKSMQETNSKTIEAQEKLVESQNSMMESLSTLAGVIQNSNIMTSYNAVSMIGKIAETGYPYLNVQKNDPVKFDLYFDEPIDLSKGAPKISIYDKDNKVVRELVLDDESYDGASGYLTIEWDTRDVNQNYVAAGEEVVYRVEAEYNKDDNNKFKTTSVGRGEVQSVLYQEGVPFIKMGDNFIVSIDYAVEFYPKS